MSFKEVFLLCLLLFTLMFYHGKQVAFESKFKVKDIQINRLAIQICRPVTNPEVKAVCIKRRIEWSNPE